MNSKLMEINHKNLDFPILYYLSEEHSINKTELSNKLLLTKTDIEKQVEQLSQLGYHLSIDAKKGYRIVKRPDILLPFEIKKKLTTSYIGQTIYYFPELSSTNTMANQMAGEMSGKMPEGTIIIAEKQSGGKGRSGKKWISPPGGIWSSIIFYPLDISTHISLFTLMAAAAVARTIDKLFPQIRVHIKWPNDILTGGRKICGILTEMSTEKKNVKWVIVGIGINVNNDSSCLPEEIRENSLSLKEITGHPINRINLISHLCSEIERFYEAFKNKDYSLIIEEWKTYNNVIGKKIKVNLGEKIIIGEAIGIDEKGALILKTDTAEIIEIISGIILP
ncbi:MAG TPA: biotin--[acetyl-CoA-carboxylase] ligase [Atribacterota bacterium]|nr:biotin--[acetyl-CoA-carboxylase] ligase [Atribacterota bacterium]